MGVSRIGVSPGANVFVGIGAEVDGRVAAGAVITGCPPWVRAICPPLVKTSIAGSSQTENASRGRCRKLLAMATALPTQSASTTSTPTTPAAISGTVSASGF